MDVGMVGKYGCSKISDTLYFGSAFANGPNKLWSQTVLLYSATVPELLTY
jgi:hypothetical protein